MEPARAWLLNPKSGSSFFLPFASDHRRKTEAKTGIDLKKNFAERPAAYNSVSRWQQRGAQIPRNSCALGRDGDREALEELTPRVYGDLRRIAGFELRFFG
jgi:hypothetical protein